MEPFVIKFAAELRQQDLAPPAAASV